MQIQNSFTVPADVDRAWATLLDIEAIAPCMPGARIESVDGDDFVATVKVKLGPVTMNYRGNARFLSKDDQTHTAVIEGSANETKGGGTAKATITTSLAAQGADRTQVAVTTDLAITGKAAQFGRGVMQDVATRLTDQFAANLEKLMTAPTPPTSDSSSGPGATGTAVPGAAGTASPAATSTAAPTPDIRADDAIDLLGAAGAPVLRRLAPIAVGIVVVAVIIWCARRRSR